MRACERMFFTEHDQSGGISGSSGGSFQTITALDGYGGDYGSVPHDTASSLSLTVIDV